MEWSSVHSTISISWMVRLLPWKLWIFYLSSSLQSTEYNTWELTVHSGEYNTWELTVHSGEYNTWELIVHSGEYNTWELTVHSGE